MSGVIKLNSSDPPEKAWLAAGWIFRATVRGILEQGGGLFPETRELLGHAIDPDRMEYLDLTCLSAPELRRLRAAAGQAYEVQHEEKGAGWNSPEFWPVYERMFRELLQLIDQDSRIMDPDAHVVDSWGETLSAIEYCWEGSKNHIAIANMLSFHADEGAKKRLTEAGLVDFLNESYEKYRAGLLRKTEEFWFYAWHDEMAGQLRCSAAPARSESELPFGARIRVTRDPLQVAQEYLASPYNGIIRFSELQEQAFPEGTPRELVLTVFGRPIPW